MIKELCARLHERGSTFMQVVHKTSKEYTRQLMLEFFRKTSVPRAMKEHQNKRDQEQSRQAN